MATTSPHTTLVVSVTVLILLHARTSSIVDATPSRELLAGGGALLHQASANNSALAVLLHNISSNAPSTGFSMATASDGQGHSFYGLGLCRVDIARRECAGCLQRAETSMVDSYNNQTAVTSLGGGCIMRYSTRNFFGNPDLVTSITSCGRNLTAREADDYTAAMGSLQRLVNLAPARPLLFAAARDQASIYTLAQCTRDLNSSSCAACLSNGITTLVTMCNQSATGSFESNSCILSFDAFVNGTTPDIPSLPPAVNAPAPTKTSMSSPPRAPAPNNNSRNGGGHGSRLTGLVWFLLLMINALDGW